MNNTHTTTQKQTNNGFCSLYSSACASNPRPALTTKTTKSGALLLVIQRKEVKKKIHRSAYDDNVLLR